MSRKQVIMIGGFGRSGSTLLEGLILKNYVVAGVGELKYIWWRGQMRNELCGCGTAFRDCPFWREVVGRTLEHFSLTAEEAERLRLSVERHRMHFLHRGGLLPSGSRAKRAEYGRVLAYLYDRIFEISGADFIVDSSKDPAHIGLATSGAEVDMNLIHLIRDPRAVAFSFLSPKVRREVHWTTEYMGRLGPVRSSLLWLFINSELDKLPGVASRYVLRYEDFVADQKGIFEFLDGLAVPRAIGGELAWHSVSGNPSRFTGEAEAIREDTRWRNQMRRFDRLIVDRLTEGARKHYGYD